MTKPVSLTSAVRGKRTAFFDRPFFLQKQRRADVDEKHSKRSHLDTLENVARGDI